MCDIFDDGFDAVDMANIAGFVETQLEGDQVEKLTEEQLSFEDTVSTKDEMLDED